MAKSRIWGTETPEPIATKFCMPGAVQDVITPGRNHACQFWWRSVKGFWCGEGSNFGLLNWLASSPLKHSRSIYRANVWSCQTDRIDCRGIINMVSGLFAPLTIRILYHM